MLSLVCCQTPSSRSSNRRVGTAHLIPVPAQLLVGSAHPTSTRAETLLNHSRIDLAEVVGCAGVEVLKLYGSRAE